MKGTLRSIITSAGVDDGLACGKPAESPGSPGSQTESPQSENQLLALSPLPKQKRWSAAAPGCGVFRSRAIPVRFWAIPAISPVVQARFSCILLALGYVYLI